MRTEVGEDVAVEVDGDAEHHDDNDQPTPVLGGHLGGGAVEADGQRD